MRLRKAKTRCLRNMYFYRTCSARRDESERATELEDSANKRRIATAAAAARRLFTSRILGLFIPLSPPEGIRDVEKGEISSASLLWQLCVFRESFSFLFSSSAAHDVPTYLRLLAVAVIEREGRKRRRESFATHSTG